MKRADLFPGQGSQFPGMAKDLYDASHDVRDAFNVSKAILGFDIAPILFEGTAEDLKQTRVTQPGIFLHSIAASWTMGGDAPAAVAGHSLGEFSALCAARAIDFREALTLVRVRAEAMQAACENEPSTMAAVLGGSIQDIEAVCEAIDEVVVPANYNAPGQLVISGSTAGIEAATERLKDVDGMKRVLPLPVGGAFHSPLMQPAAADLKAQIERTTFRTPRCPVYQNVTARPTTDAGEIARNLEAQLTGPVRWMQTIRAMDADGITDYREVGPGKVLTGLNRKIL